MNTFLAILVLAFTVMLTGCSDPKNASQETPANLELSIACFGQAQYYYGVTGVGAARTTIVTPVMGADGRGVHCQEFGK